MIHHRKTGAMFQVSLRLGGLVAGADPQRQAALEIYGRRLGLAFQIADDLLDVRGEEAAVGKRLGKDSNRGKLTFPGLLGVDESRQYAERLIDEAVAALAPLARRPKDGWRHWRDSSWKGINDGRPAFHDSIAARLAAAHVAAVEAIGRPKCARRCAKSSPIARPILLRTWASSSSAWPCTRRSTSAATG